MGAAILLAASLSGCAALNQRLFPPKKPAAQPPQSALAPASAAVILPALVQSLKSADPDTRLKSVQAIKSLGPAAEPAAKELVLAMDDEDEAVRSAAGSAVAALGTKAVPALRRAAQTGGPRLKTRAGEALAALGPAAAPPSAKPAAEKLPLIKGSLTLAELMQALKSDMTRYRMEAIEALEVKDSDLGAAIPVLVHVTINDPEPSVRHVAAWRLAEMGQAPTSALILALTHPDDTVRANAIEALGEIGPKTPVVIPSLIEAFRDPAVRGHAIMAMAKFGGDSIVPLIKTLHDDQVWEAASRSLIHIGKPAAPALTESLKSEAISERAGRTLVGIGMPAVPALIAGFRDRSYRERAGVLVNIGPEAIPDLMKAVGGKEESLRQGSALTLCEMGPVAAEAVSLLIETVRKYPKEKELYPLWKFGAAGAPGLIRTATDADPEIRLLALEALAPLRPMPEDGFRALIRALYDKDRRIRDLAAVTLTDLGAAGVPTLARALRDPERDMRRAAADALGFIGAPAKHALPELKAALEDRDPGVRKRAAYALGQLGPRAKKAAAALTHSLLDDDTRWWAAEALEKIGPAAVPALFRVLRSQPDLLRFRAAFLLNTLDPDAKGVRETLGQALLAWEPSTRYEAALALSGNPQAALHARPALVKALEDEDAGVRFAAAYTLGRMGEDAVMDLLLAAGEKGSPRAPAAVQALEMVGPSAAGVLVAGLENPDLRPFAAETLVRIGAGAVPELLRSLDREQRQEFVVEVLGRIGAPAVPALTHSFTGGKGFAQKGARKALEKIGTPEALKVVNPTGTEVQQPPQATQKKPQAKPRKKKRQIRRRKKSPPRRKAR